MSFTAKNTNCGGTNGDNGATGGECNAFVKVLNSGDFSSLLFKQTETTAVVSVCLNSSELKSPEFRTLTKALHSPPVAPLSPFVPPQLVFLAVNDIQYVPTISAVM